LIVELPYGRGQARYELPVGAHVEFWSGPVVPEGADDDAGRARVARALDDPIGLPALERLAGGARRVAILISGKDRVAGASVYLPVILDRLRAAGVPEDGIEIVCATGTHARHTIADIQALVGSEVAERVPFRAHDCDAADGFADLGRTQGGTPIQFDRRVVEADLRVLTGRIVHHYFAGFSGGRKSLLPGVAARATIVANHRRVLDFEGGCRVHSAVFGGNLDGNPVHLDMVEAARRTGPNFVVNTVLDVEERIAGVFAGELERAHEAGCRAVDATATFGPAEPADVVLASAGGHPYDINLIQSVKTLFNHAPAVRPGGVFILVAEAAAGILSGMKSWMGIDDRSALEAAMAARYDLAAHNSLMLRELVETRHVILVSSLHAADVAPLRLVPARTLAEAFETARQRLGTTRSLLRVISHGNVTQTRRPVDVCETARPRRTAAAPLATR
jgi:nickel-dependent lactate racemase